MSVKITREEAYEEIIKTNILSMSQEQIIAYCLQWIGFEETNNDYPLLFKKMESVHSNGGIEEREMLYNLFKSAKQYKLIGTNNTYLESLLNNQYEVEGEIEKLVECKCCHYRSIVDASIEVVCPICGWSDKVLQYGNILLEIAQDRFKERGHIMRRLSKKEIELNNIKYVKG